MQYLTIKYTSALPGKQCTISIQPASELLMHTSVLGKGYLQCESVFAPITVRVQKIAVYGRKFLSAMTCLNCTCTNSKRMNKLVNGLTRAINLDDNGDVGCNNVCVNRG